MTARLTVGPLVLVLILLEETPLESTPTIVNVYVLAGVIPFGVVVDVLLLPHGRHPEFHNRKFGHDDSPEMNP